MKILNSQDINTSTKNIYRQLLNRENQILFSVLLICFALRIFNFTSASIWSDEGATLTIAHKTPTEILKVSFGDVNPPLYGWIVHYWGNAFGYNHISLRFLSILFSLFTAVIIFRTARKFINFLSAIIATTLFSLSNMQIYYAEEARCYALIGFLSAFSFYYLVVFLKGKKKWALLGLFLVNLAILYTHYLAAILFIAEGIVVLLFFYNRIKLLLYYFLSQGVMVLLFLPWFFRSWFSAGSMASSWYPELSSDLVWNFFMEVFNSEYIIISLCILLVLSFIGFYKLLSSQKRKRFLALLLMSLVPLTVVCLITEYYVRIFYSRYELFTTIPIFIFFGYAISSLRIHLVLRVMVFLLCVSLSLSQIKVDAFRGQEWDKAAIAGSSFIDGKTSVLLYPIFAYGCYNYYALPWEYQTDYKKLNESLALYNIHSLIDTISIQHIHGGLHNKIVMFTTHYWERDDKPLVEYLLRTRRQIYFKQFWGIRLYVFDR